MKIDREKQEELHSEFWEELENMPNEKNPDKSFAVFMQHFLTMKLGRVVTNNSIYEEFVNKYIKTIEAENDYEKVKSILIEMLEYKDIFLDLKNSRVFLDDSILPYFDIEAYYPFLMKIKGKNSSLFTKISKIIESFYVRRFVYGLPAGATKSIFASACKDLAIDDNILNSFKTFLKLKENKQRFPTDEEFKDSLKTKNLYEDGKKITKAILFILEKFKNRDLEIEFEDISIEHVLPQNDYDKLDNCWREIISNSDYDKQIHTLGNLTILKSEDNQSIKDNCFDTKKETYLNSGFKLNEYLVDVDLWNSESIKTFSNYLSELALDRWRDLD